MSNIIPPMVSSSPPPLDDNIDDDDDDDFGDFASANLHYDNEGEDDDEEDYVEYGTALEPLDEDTPVRKKPFSVEDQVVKDSHGRRRFHGAFTGGFSAGFFNTVGSLEGWTPSSFKSSRSERATVMSQKARDFMDDEDMSEFGISPSVLRATHDFNGEQKKRKRETAQLSDGPIPGKPVLEDLLEPVRETVGVKLLRKMGWKPGQGVGPRLSRAEKNQARKEQKTTNGQVYGCALPHQNLSGTETDSSGDEESMKHLLFAPEDNELLLCKPKVNVFGIGYSGLDKRPILSRHINLFEPSSLIMEEKKKKVAISGQAFGVGALEDDDEDIYAKEDMTQYDFSLDEPTNSKQNHLLRLSSHTHVGEVLERFTRSCAISSNKRNFPPPRLSSGFQPIHNVRKTRFQLDPKNRAPERQAFAASDRAAILSESASQGPIRHEKKEVPEGQAFAVSDEAAILSNSASQCLIQQEGIQQTAAALEVTEKQLPIPSEDTNKFNKLKPFASNPDKQKRFEQYLALVKICQGDKLKNLQPSNMCEFEKIREWSDFKTAFKIIEPLCHSGPVSDRFVAAVQPDDSTNPLAPVENTADTNGDKKMASRLKMFGRLTRETTAWQPCSLLCKRFNIVEPNVSHLPTASKKPSRFSVFDYLDASALNGRTVNGVSPTSSETNVEAKPGTLITEEIDKATQEEKKEYNKEIVEQENSLSFPNPPEKVDLYKAIFLSSSDESEIEPENEDDETEKQEESLSKSNSASDVGIFNPNPPVTTSNTSLARGVFANLDLDAINMRRNLPKQPPPPVIEPNNSKCVEVVDIEEDVYGPKLPSLSLMSQSPILANKKGVFPSIFRVPQEEWVEKPKTHKAKHQKKEKHKKSSKHKAKKKKRKK